MHSVKTNLGKIGRELKDHAPFTIGGTLSGVVLMLIVVYAGVPPSWSETAYWVSHPAHVFLSAVATAGMYRRHSRGKLLATIAVGFVGCIGIATLSDCIIPFLGEKMLGLHTHVHLGIVEMPWLIICSVPPCMPRLFSAKMPNMQ